MSDHSIPHLDVRAPLSPARDRTEDRSAGDGEARRHEAQQRNHRLWQLSAELLARVVHEDLEVRVTIRVEEVWELLKEPQRVLCAHWLVAETLGKFVSDALKRGIRVGA